MSLHAMPVSLPYRLVDDETAPFFSLVTDAVASSPQGAFATAKAIALTQATLAHGRPPAVLLTDRARVAPPRHEVQGPYAYVFLRGTRIPSICFPANLDNDAAAEFDQTLAGLDPRWIHGLVMDCGPLRGITSSAIAVLIAHSRRLRLHLCRLDAAISRILTTVGLDRVLAIHPDLPGALRGLIEGCRRPATGP